MQVLHLSTTPLVGAPGRICRALREHGIDARWGVLHTDSGLYEKMIFDLDLRWETDRDEIIDLAEHCDVLHLHNFIDLDNREFYPINFRKRWDSRRAIVRHFHSTPALIAKGLMQTESSVLACPIPKLVIAQYPERFFPNARLVPNIVHDETVPKTTPREYSGPLRIGFAPSRFNPSRSSRWDTKGYPETLKVLKRLGRSKYAKTGAIEIDIIELVPHRECLARKQRCHLIIDDLVTGSYHLNTLESLAQGSAVISYMDRRTQQALAELTGRFDFPAMSVGLEDVFDVLGHLCCNPQAVMDLGQQSRSWMQAYWSPKQMALHFIDAYECVLANPYQAFPDRLGTDLCSRWMSVGLHDATWRSRARHWPAEAPAWWLTARGAVGRIARRAGALSRLSQIR